MWSHSPEHGLAVAAEPVVEQGRIDPAEVGVELQVVVVEVGQAGVLADDAALDRRPGHEQARAGPWSVPRLPFSLTRRPNSEKVISRTRRSWPVVFSVWKKCADRAARSPSRWRRGGLAGWVSKPSRLT